MLKTPLHANHLSLNAKMGEFAGYDMPLYYKEGVIKEHEWVRSSAGLFDVSHMGQVIVTGPEADLIGFWEKMTPSNFANIGDGVAKYTVLTSPKGGMVDDLIVTRIWHEKFFAVLNAGRKNVDLEWLRGSLPKTLTLEYSEGQGLIALQGPKAESVLRAVYKIDTSAQDYMSAKYYELDGESCLVSRLGYTGEDGFEISVSAAKAPAVWDKLAAHPDVKPIGLAARDSLRLEMGYPLYGHDIDETTSPSEASLNWILKTKPTNKPERTRVGVKLLDKGVAREGAELRNEVGEKIGVLTSGGFSPTLKESIGQGYIETELSAPGTQIFVNVRDRNIPAVVSSMPFVPARTKMKKEKGGLVNFYETLEYLTPAGLALFFFKIFLLFVLIFIALLVHELGHFAMARLFRVKVKSVQIGSGRNIWQRLDNKGTIWRISHIPFGAHVELSGLKDVSGWKRILVILGGPGANLILPFVVLTAFYIIAGQPSSPTVMVGIEKGMVAEKAGMKPGDNVLAIDGTPVKNFKDIWRTAYLKGERESVYTVKRGDKALDIKLTPEWSEYVDEEGISRANSRFGILWTHRPCPVKTFYSINGVDVKDKPDLARELIAKNFDKPMLAELKGPDLKPVLMQLVLHKSVNPNLLNKKSKEHKFVYLGPTRDHFYLYQDIPAQIYDAFYYAGQRIGKIAILPLQLLPIDPYTVKDEDAVTDKKTPIRNALYYFFHNLVIASIFFGLINLLPLPYLDGGHIMIDRIESLRKAPLTNKAKAKLYAILFALLYLSVLLANSDNIPGYIDSRLKKVHEFVSNPKEAKNGRAQIHQ